jgi:hypothetical protein
MLQRAIFTPCLTPQNTLKSQLLLLRMVTTGVFRYFFDPEKGHNWRFYAESRISGTVTQKPPKKRQRTGNFGFLGMWDS